MKSSRILLIFTLLIIALGFYQMGKNPDFFNFSENNQTENKTDEQFSGILSEVYTGCFFDAECYVIVDGKHVTLLHGWSREEVGQIIDSPDGIGGLESVIGQEVEVFAGKIDANTYTLYGSQDYYVKVKK